MEGNGAAAAEQEALIEGRAKRKADAVSNSKHEKKSTKPVQRHKSRSRKGTAKRKSRRSRHSGDDSSSNSSDSASFSASSSSSDSSSESSSSSSSSDEAHEKRRSKRSRKKKKSQSRRSSSDRKKKKSKKKKKDSKKKSKKHKKHGHSSRRRSSKSSGVEKVGIDHTYTKAELADLAEWRAKGGNPIAAEKKLNPARERAKQIEQEAYLARHREKLLSADPHSFGAMMAKRKRSVMNKAVRIHMKVNAHQEKERAKIAAMVSRIGLDPNALMRQ
eukprot:INCI11626.1.p1 GENE.INCI11626.1~~INCI11626.1.p1  ORF type:complete len:274 (-),score=70.48 INCI11626.1:407-1228(-)